MIAHVSMVHGKRLPTASGGSGGTPPNDLDDVEVLPTTPKTSSPAKSGPRPEKNIKCDLCSYRLVKYKLEG